MRIEIGGSEAHRGSLFVASEVEVGCTGGVDGNEHVRHYSTSPVDGAAANRVVFLALVDLHAVRTEHLAVAIAVIEVIGILLAAGIGFLDASAGRCMVARHGDPQAAAVAEIERLLHKALAEGTAAYNGSSVVILDGSREYFAGRCRILVYKHHEFHVLKFAAAGGVEILARLRTAFQINHTCTLRKEHVREEERLVEEAAAVVAEVEYHPFHPKGDQLVACPGHLFISRAGEFAKAEVSCRVVDHECRVQAVHGNLAAGNLERHCLPVAKNGDGHFRPGRAAHLANHAVLRELHAGYILFIHLEDTVAGLKPDLFRRSSGDDFQHDGCIVWHVELYAYAVEIAGKLRFGFLEDCRGHIHGMGIQRPQSRGDGGIGDGLAVHRIHIMLIQRLKHEIKFAPVPEFSAHQVLVLLGFLESQDGKGADEHPEQSYQD